jgi:hypothetical protein
LPVFFTYMKRIKDHKIVILAFVLFSSCIQISYAGPPFVTDDPQPVDFKHWEFYISSINTLHPDIWSGTSPHLEVNYGLIPDLQVHLLLPMNYNYFPHRNTDFGYGNTELGVKYCFIHETDNMPQIGIFPIVEIPTIKNAEFSNGKAQVFIPVWAQKSWGKITTYGGLGYCINPGIDNKNWILTGWEVQYDFSQRFMLGGELYYHTADTDESKAVTACNVGGSVNLTQNFHFIFSVGHSLVNDNFISSYLGLLWTI